MTELNDQQRADYYHRSYKAVDGLWFMKVEDAFGFEKALDIDNEVWKVFPKIQARMIKEMLGMSKGMEALAQCFAAKLQLDGFTFDLDKDADESGFSVTIQKCPWHNVMIRSKREHLSGRVGARICTTEISVWAAEFGKDIVSALGDRICAGAECCMISFRQKGNRS